MYDELVKQLREADEKSMCGECGLNLHTGATKKGVLFAEAADAIEEQQAAEKKYLANISALETENQHLKRERAWIPVTERLPNGEAKRYPVAAPLMSLGLRVSICYYADNLEEVDEYDFKDEKHS